MEIPVSFLPFINIAVVAGLVIAVIVGYVKGFFWELIKVLGLVVALFLSWIIAPGISQLIFIIPKKWAPFAGTSVGDLVYQRLNYLVWFIIILVVCLIILQLIKPVFKVLTEIPIIKQVNKILGILLGVVQAFLIMLTVTYLLNSALVSNGKDVIEQTFLKYVQSAARGISTIATNSFSENVAIQKLISDPLNLNDEDIKSIIDWLSKSKLTSEQIRDFLSGYGIDVNKINEYLGF